MSETKKKSKFNFEELKAGATSSDPLVRKNMFIDYFERFSEFPSYLFDNENGIDPKLAETIRDLNDDMETGEKMKKGIADLMVRLSF